jgi:pre-mRNA-splicing factor ATP-dependent RNA helicase DHX15/PRP43
MDPPAPETLMRALELLNYLGALDDEGKMTPEGEKMAEFPLDPQLSKVLLTSTKYNCVEEMLTLVSCMSSPNIFLRPKEKMAEATDAHAKFTHPEGDHLTIITTFHEYLRKNMDVDWCFKNFLNHRHLKSAVDVRDQLRLLLEKADIKVKEDLPLQLNPVNIKKCLLNGYFTQIAILQKNNVYLTVKDSQVVVIHPSSVLTYRPQFALYHELVLTKKNYMRTVIDIKPSWFYEIAPEYFRPESIKNIETRKTLAKIEK